MTEYWTGALAEVQYSVTTTFFSHNKQYYIIEIKFSLLCFPFLINYFDAAVEYSVTTAFLQSRYMATQIWACGL